MGVPPGQWAEPNYPSVINKPGVRLFARRTFTTPKIRTFTTPKFGHFPPPTKNICQEDNCHPQFFFFFFWRTFLGFFDLQLMEDIKDGKEEEEEEANTGSDYYFLYHPH